MLKEPYKTVMGRCRYAGGNYCVHTTENNVIQNFALVYEVDDLKELGWGNYLNFEADGIQQICRSCLWELHERKRLKTAEQEWQKEQKENYKCACENLDKLIDKLKKEGKVICRTCFHELNGGDWQRQVKNNNGAFKYLTHLSSEKCCSGCSLEKLDKEAKEYWDKRDKERQKKKDERFRELKQKIERTPWGLEKLTQMQITLAENFGEISETQADNLLKLLEEQHQKGEIEYKRKKREERMENNEQHNQRKKTEDNEQLDNINQQYESDSYKEIIINSSKLEKEQDKKQAQTYLKKIIEAEILIKIKKFSAEVLRKLKEIATQPKIYQLLNKNKRVDQTIASLQNLEKQGGKQSINDDYSRYLVGLLLCGVITIILVIGLKLIVRPRRRK